MPLEAGRRSADGRCGRYGRSGGSGLAFKADALWVGTGIEGVDGPEGRLAAASVEVSLANY